MYILYIVYILYAPGKGVFDTIRLESGTWRITANPTRIQINGGFVFEVKHFFNKPDLKTISLKLCTAQ